MKITIEASGNQIAWMKVAILNGIEDCENHIMTCKDMGIDFSGWSDKLESLKEIYYQL